MSTRRESNLRLGIALMIATVFVFAIQDVLSRQLASRYNVLMIVMIRYWFFAAFVIFLAARQSGGLRRVIPSAFPVLQVFRGLLLAGEVCVMVTAFVLLGLINSHAVFTATPLIVAALSGPVLGERVGWRRWLAIGFGCVGVLIVLAPGSGVFTLKALVPLAAALMFALYSLLTRYVSRSDSAATSFFWTGTAGAALMSLVGIWSLEPIFGWDWALLLGYCVTAALSHWLLIKCYEVAEAGAVQPFAYLHLVFVSAFGLALGETLRWNVALGAAIVVGAGLFALWRDARKKRTT